MSKNKTKLTKFEKWFRTLRRFERFIYRPFFPYTKFGHTEPYDGRAYILVGNHYSLFDVIFTGTATVKPVHFMAKKDLFKKGLMKKFVLKCQCIPVSRDGTDAKAIMQAMKYLKNGESIALYPEGTRNKSDEIFLPFKSGATALSIKTKTPIIPVVQIKKIRFLRRSYVIYGEPIEFAEYYDRPLNEESIKACDEALRNKMLELYQNLSEIVVDKKKRKGK
ncbi:MAG: 1-acyl-sn-glycerol-3-phosphate acyltransferase [Clostridia bacterium]|nr:1-acyl-sn-glycerol-3-phosphate acyltransferase [Clostridia bacterium]